MAHHTVAANVVMAIFILGGLLVSTRIKQEVFPEFQSNSILGSVAYPGASPEEVEQGIILAMEDVVRGLDGVKEVTSTAAEGMALVKIELVNGVNPKKRPAGYHERDRPHTIVPRIGGTAGHQLR